VLGLAKIVENVQKNYLMHSTLVKVDYPTNSLNIEICSRRRVLLEKPPVLQILKEFSVFYGNIIK